MISEAQHSFVKGRSTVTSLMQFSNFVIGEMEAGRQVNAVYTDFSKAFDRVNHRMLLSNLSVRFRGSLLCWMGSCLTDHTQQVTLDDYLTETIHCHSGVPQGSHLGPLFIIADIEGLVIFEHTSILSYADDLELYITVETVEDCYRFQSDLDLLNYWCLVNRFDLNAEKFKTISFRRCPV
jgi:hypothetical protein